MKKIKYALTAVAFLAVLGVYYVKYVRAVPDTEDETGSGLGLGASEFQIPVPRAKDEDGDGDVPRIEPTANDGWYCPCYNARHTFTSGDTLAPPLKYKWHWKLDESGNVYQVLSSDRKVFVTGQNKGVHHWVLDIETGAKIGKDPYSKGPNDRVEGWPSGTYNGNVYCCDDGCHPFPNFADVWGPVQIDPEQQVWIFFDQIRGDGPHPGIYCYPIKHGIRVPNLKTEKAEKWIFGGHKWWVGQEFPLRDWTRRISDGDAATGPGVVYAFVKWQGVTNPDLKDGLSCYDLETGKEKWHVGGEFEKVSGGQDFCAAVTKQGDLGIFAVDDGRVLCSTKVGRLETHPMVVGNTVRVYTRQGTLLTFEISEKDGRRSLRKTDTENIGRYQGPKMRGHQNHAFCYSADGTLYVVNGTTVFGKRKGQKVWRGSLPPAAARDVGKLGQPIIAYGKLLAVGDKGVVCWDTEGATK